jgi:hypothetical protein
LQSKELIKLLCIMSCIKLLWRKNDGVLNRNCWYHTLCSNGNWIKEMVIKII